MLPSLQLGDVFNLPVYVLQALTDVSPISGDDLAFIRKSESIV